MLPSHSAGLGIAGFALAALVAFAAAGAEAPPPADAKALPEPDLSLLLESGKAARAAPMIAGLDYRLISVPAFGLKIHAFAFDGRRFHLRTVQQTEETGNRAADFLERPEDIFAIDGGFFEKDDQGRLSPSGLLVVDGEEVAPEHERGGSGVLQVGNGGVAIAYRAKAPTPSAMESAVQVGPILVDPGGKVGIYSNQGDRARRSAICLRPGEVVAVVVDGDGLSLFQFANLLAIPFENGGVGCDVAINLDGGPSTQAIYRGGGRTIEIDGESAVQNALVVSVPKP
jgi:uncharacterized protein YigE (DUF2233 family)